MKYINQRLSYYYIRFRKTNVCHYCNSLLYYSLPDLYCVINLQSVQNVTAQLITGK